MVLTAKFLDFRAKSSVANSLKVQFNRPEDLFGDICFELGLFLENWLFLEKYGTLRETCSNGLSKVPALCRKKQAGAVFG